MNPISTAIGFIISTVSSHALLLDLQMQKIMKDEISIGAGSSNFLFMGYIC